MVYICRLLYNMVLGMSRKIAISGKVKNLWQSKWTIF